MLYDIGVSGGSFDNPNEDASQPQPATRGDITLAFVAIEMGDGRARERLLEMVYDDLRAMARAKMAHEPAGHTLQPTALVHEAFVRLVGDGAAWQSRAQFFAAASLAMRRILVDRARRVKSKKRGGGLTLQESVWDSTPVLRNETDAADESLDLEALDEALTKLDRMDARLSRIVHLRFFAGLTNEQIAEMTESSERTVKRDWAFARAWLHQEVTGKSES
ncbi:MAG: ECF-type sigma factor [Phycisphaerales bacterium]